MSSLTVCAGAIIASVLAIILKKNNAEYSFILTVCACAIIVTYIAGVILEAVSEIENVYLLSNMSTAYLTLLLKCVGVCFITEFTCDSCKDAGQSALADIVLFSGRIFVLITAIPLFSELLNTVINLSGG